VVTTPVAVLTSLTWASGMAASVESETAPSRRAGDCAHSDVTQQSKRPLRKTQRSLAASIFRSLVAIGKAEVVTHRNKKNELDCMLGTEV
jgi:hypothetical protein